MKKRLRILAFAGLAVSCVLLVFFLCGFGRNRISVRQVDKIQLTGQSGTTAVELKPEDIRKFLNCYNLSRYVGEVTTEHCVQTFFVRIEFGNGSWIGIVDHEGARMKITGSETESFWIDNALLLHTIQNLAQDHGLILETWGC